MNAPEPYADIDLASPTADVELHAAGYRMGQAFAAAIDDAVAKYIVPAVTLVAQLGTSPGPMLRSVAQSLRDLADEFDRQADTLPAE